MNYRLQWVGTGLSRPPLNFRPGNLLCWNGRPDSAKSSHSGTGQTRSAVDISMSLLTQFYL